MDLHTVVSFLGACSQTLPGCKRRCKNADSDRFSGSDGRLPGLHVDPDAEREQKKNKSSTRTRGRRLPASRLPAGVTSGQLYSGSSRPGVIGSDPLRGSAAPQHGYPQVPAYHSPLRRHGLYGIYRVLYHAMPYCWTSILHGRTTSHCLLQQL